MLIFYKLTSIVNMTLTDKFQKNFISIKHYKKLYIFSVNDDIKNGINSLSSKYQSL